MPYMLDANTCIYVMKCHPQLTPQAALDECAISQIVLGELEYGVANSAEERRAQNRRSLLDFLGSIEIYPLTHEIATVYGILRAALKRKGTPIGPMDYWIAAHALALDLPLVTHNTREFSRVPELTIDTWMEGEP